ncbi:MAG: exonuclease SbcCD subunit D [Bacillus sp. (in: Bacteria)]|nr:exonuclease SbcCD subunit D [Bacillus sp. (in: firmicutes)]
MIRFIHCADAHLGRAIAAHGDMNSQFVEKMRQAAYISFENIIDKALEEEVDFVLISGDVYDHEKRSIKGEWFIKKQGERLQAKQIPLFIIHGNHDPLGNRSTNNTNLSDNNIHIFSSTVDAIPVETKSGERVYIYGFSYPKKAFYENPVHMYQRKEDEDAFHIAMLHGQEKMQEDHDPYAPFSVKELQEKGFDYWALGHIHKRQILSYHPPVVYPGNVQGSTRKELGEKGAYVVTISKANTELDFFATAPIQWERVEVSIQELDSYDNLLEQIEEVLTSFKTTPKMFLIDLYIHGSGILHDDLSDNVKQQELLSLLREEWFDSYDIWVDRISFNTAPAIDREVLKEQDHLLGDVVRTADQLKETLSLDEVINPLYQHSTLGNHLQTLSDEELLEIIEEAEVSLLTPLLKEVGKR